MLKVGKYWINQGKFLETQGKRIGKSESLLRKSQETLVSKLTSKKGL